MYCISALDSIQLRFEVVVQMLSMVHKDQSTTCTGHLVLGNRISAFKVSSYLAYLHDHLRPTLWVPNFARWKKKSMRSAKTTRRGTLLVVFLWLGFYLSGRQQPGKQKLSSLYVHRVFPTYPIGVTRVMCNLGSCIYAHKLLNKHRQFYSTNLLVYPNELPILQAHRMINALTVTCRAYTYFYDKGSSFLISPLTC